MLVINEEKDLKYSKWRLLSCMNWQNCLFAYFYVLFALLIFFFSGLFDHFVFFLFLDFILGFIFLYLFFFKHSSTKKLVVCAYIRLSANYVEADDKGHIGLVRGTKLYESQRWMSNYCKTDEWEAAAGRGCVVLCSVVILHSYSCPYLSDWEIHFNYLLISLMLENMVSFFVMHVWSVHVWVSMQVDIILE